MDSIHQKALRYHIDNEGIIHFQIISDGTERLEWPKRLEQHTGRSVGEYAEIVIHSSDFRPTSGFVTNVAVLPGKMWKSDRERTPKNIQAEAYRRKMSKLTVEATCLIRMTLTDAELEKMGLLWIIAMYKTSNSAGIPYMLCAHNTGIRSPCLLATDMNSDEEFDIGYGFAFEVSRA